MPSDPLSTQAITAEIAAMRKAWLWFVVMGSALILVGMAAIGSAFVATLATVMVIGTLALLGGFASLLSGVWARNWQGSLLHVLMGILYLVIGIFMIEQPGRAAADLTLLMAACFLVGGLFRVVAALMTDFEGRWWVLLNGIITFILGMAIWRQWPESSHWVIGLFVGIDLLFAGWTWVMLGFGLKAAASES